MRIFISFISFFLCSILHAQDITVEQDSIKKTSHRLRVGVDLSKLVKTSIISDYSAFEVAADYIFSKRYYISGSFGNESKTIDTPQLNYTAKGSYATIGVDFNAYKNWTGMNNAIITGIKYGISNHSQTVNSYSIINSDDYWDESSVINTQIEHSKITNHWIALVIGIKTEVFKNVYLSLFAELRNMIVNNQPENFSNLYVPGFGKTTKDANWGAGFGYHISYSIPIYKN